MAAIALDLTPVVDKLLARPFDRNTLEAASSAVAGKPQAYATALRCAAKRTSDRLAAAFWFAEAARVHESVDDLGGAIALLFRARECDPTSPAIREALAVSMTKLAMRAGISFTFGAPADGAPQTVPSAPPPTEGETARPIPRESGLRPPPGHPRDTLPDLFGIDASTSRTLPDTEWGDYQDVSVVAEVPAPRTEVPETRDSSPIVIPLAHARRVEPLLPPSDPDTDVNTLVPVPPDAPLLRAVADIATPTRRSSELPPTVPPSMFPPPPVRTEIGHGTPPPPSVSPPPPLVRVSALRPDSSPSPSSSVQIAPPPETELVLEGPKTERPPGDVVVSALFEELHALHFLDDVRSGANFVAKVLAEHMGASTVLVHVYDINSRHFVIMSALGNRASALADYATPEDDAFVAELMKDGEAIVVLDPKDDPRFSRGRFLLVEPSRSVACAPAVIERRYLGLLEVVDPLDGSEFGEDDRNALAYAASAFARFLDRRGIVLSEEDEETPSLAPPAG
ncbi:MAG TPA: GAF domain-containing protein [Polyangiaceae bacterium]|nr:GAF domain-containing protein [Polyangiaceae bacterium]